MGRAQEFGLFTYNEAKCERDTGIIVDGIIHDLKYNGNAKTYLNAGRYYEGTQSLINGQEQQTAAALNQTKTIITDYILTQAPYTALQSVTTQYTDSGSIQRLVQQLRLVHLWTVLLLSLTTVLHRCLTWLIHVMVTITHKIPPCYKHWY